MYLDADYIHLTPHKGSCRVRIYSVHKKRTAREDGENDGPFMGVAE
jgi:hypothetical protein